jgi:hypothetical protein
MHFESAAVWQGKLSPADLAHLANDPGDAQVADPDSRGSRSELLHRLRDLPLELPDFLVETA